MKLRPTRLSRIDSPFPYTTLFRSVDDMALPPRESLRLALEARALDARQHGVRFGFGLDFGLDLAKGCRNVEFAADAKARDPFNHQIGRASWRERVCPSVYIAVVGEPLKNERKYEQ